MQRFSESLVGLGTGLTGDQLTFAFFTRNLFIDNLTAAISLTDSQQVQIIQNGLTLTDDVIFLTQPLGVVCNGLGALTLTENTFSNLGAKLNSGNSIVLTSNQFLVSNRALTGSLIQVGALTLGASEDVVQVAGIVIAKNVVTFTAVNCTTVLFNIVSASAAIIAENIGTISDFTGTDQHKALAIVLLGSTVPNASGAGNLVLGASISNNIFTGASTYGIVLTYLVVDKVAVDVAVGTSLTNNYCMLSDNGIYAGTNAVLTSVSANELFVLQTGLTLGLNSSQAGGSAGIGNLANGCMTGYSLGGNLALSSKNVSLNCQVPSTSNSTSNCTSGTFEIFNSQETVPNVVKMIGNNGLSKMLAGRILDEKK